MTAAERIGSERDAGALLPESVLALLDVETAQAVGEVDRTLIHLAFGRSLQERLRTGASLARMAARFRGSPEGR